MNRPGLLTIMGKKNSSHFAYSAVHGKLMAMGNYLVSRKPHSIKRPGSEYSEYNYLGLINDVEPTETNPAHVTNCYENIGPSNNRTSEWTIRAERASI